MARLTSRQLINSVEIVELYLKFKNAFNYGNQKYSTWKNMIKHITGIHENKIIRKIFYHLLNKNKFQKQTKVNSIFYIFNPTNKKQIVIDKVIFE